MGFILIYCDLLKFTVSNLNLVIHTYFTKEKTLNLEILKLIYLKKDHCWLE